MCGIVGYVGHRDAANIIISGLKRLEYRGYDSAGLALYPKTGNELVVVKRAGKIVNLEAGVLEMLPSTDTPYASLGIGHTRWATHGQPTEENAHPHLSRNGKFAVVHNGIIDNYAHLKDKLIEEGYTFSSETDSEVIAHLLEACYDGDLRTAVASVIEKLEGTYGICVISALHPGLMIAARKGSPIAIGVCNGETVIASDVSAIVSHTDQVIFMDDGDILTATADSIEITSIKNVSVSHKPTTIDWDVDEIEKGGYDKISEVQQIIQHTGALQYTEKMACQQAELAIAELAHLPPSENRTMLENIARLSVYRSN